MQNAAQKRAHRFGNFHVRRQKHEQDDEQRQIYGHLQLNFLTGARQPRGRDDGGEEDAGQPDQGQDAAAEGDEIEEAFVLGVALGEKWVVAVPENLTEVGHVPAGALVHHGPVVDLGLVAAHQPATVRRPTSVAVVGAEVPRHARSWF